MPARKRSVLIVDQDAFLAGIYARRFEMGKWHVRVAETIEDARKAIVKRVPEAVLVDLAIGDEALVFVRELRNDPKTLQVRVVVLTTLGQREQIAQAQEAGAAAYLLKGHFVPQEVREKVERLVAAPEQAV